MNSKINNNIKVDFHIHSVMSSYKEDKEWVKKSTIDHLDTLFKKLEENEINLFSITDHNRFSSELYLECKKIIQNQKYKNVKNIVPRNRIWC